MKGNTTGPAAMYERMAIRFEVRDGQQPLEIITSAGSLPGVFRKHHISGADVELVRYDFGTVFSQKVIVHNNIFWLHIFHMKADAVLKPVANALVISLHYMLKGNLVGDMNGEQVNLKEGRYQLYALAENVAYPVKFIAGEYIVFHTTIPHNIITEMVNIYPDDDKLKQLAALNTKGVFYPHLFRISNAIDRHIRMILSQKTARLSEQQLARDLIWEEQLLALFSHYLEDRNNFIAQEEWNRKGQVRVADLKQYVLDNMMENEGEGLQHLGLEAILRKVRMKKTDFRKAMLEKFGCSWKDLVNTVRLEKAASLLEEQPERSVADIGSSLGYSASTHFSRAFKIYFGSSPMDYRKNKLSGNRL